MTLLYRKPEITHDFAEFSRIHSLTVTNNSTQLTFFKQKIKVPWL